MKSLGIQNVVIPSRARDLVLRPQVRLHVYIMSSKSRVIYTGMSGTLTERVLRHKRGEIEGFTQRYKITRLVYYEPFRYVKNCINREKQIKAWTRAKRVALIESMNPTWEDLAADWFDEDGELNPKSRSLAALGMTNWRNEDRLAQRESSKARG